MIPEGWRPPLHVLPNLLLVVKPLNLVQVVFLDVVVAFEKSGVAKRHVSRGS